MGIYFDNGLQVRRAMPEDAAFLARLTNIAGEGLPCFLWAQAAPDGTDPFRTGETRARRDEGGFSWKNAHVATWHGVDVGLIIDYDINGADSAEGASPAIAPLITLEAQAVGTRYVNVLAVLPTARRRGIAQAMMQHLRQRTTRDITLIVRSENRNARAVYLVMDFEPVDTRPLGAGGPPDLTGDWMLMRRTADARAPADTTRPLLGADR